MVITSSEMKVINMLIINLFFIYLFYTKIVIKPRLTFAGRGGGLNATNHLHKIQKSRHFENIF